MSNEQAWKEAVGRWGDNAFASYDSQRYAPYVVGIVTDGDGARSAKGQGSSWEQAFENADREK